LQLRTFKQLFMILLTVSMALTTSCTAAFADTGTLPSTASAPVAVSSGPVNGEFARVVAINGESVTFTPQSFSVTSSQGSQQVLPTGESPDEFTVLLSNATDMQITGTDDRLTVGMVVYVDSRRVGAVQEALLLDNFGGASAQGSVPAALSRAIHPAIVRRNRGSWSSEGQQPLKPASWIHIGGIRRDRVSAPLQSSSYGQTLATQGLVNTQFVYDQYWPGFHYDSGAQTIFSSSVASVSVGLEVDVGWGTQWDWPFQLTANGTLLEQGLSATIPVSILPTDEASGGSLIENVNNVTFIDNYGLNIEPYINVDTSFGDKTFNISLDPFSEQDLTTALPPLPGQTIYTNPVSEPSASMSVPDVPDLSASFTFGMRNQITGVGLTYVPVYTESPGFLDQNATQPVSNQNGLSADWLGVPDNQNGKIDAGQLQYDFSIQTQYQLYLGVSVVSEPITPWENAGSATLESPVNSLYGVNFQASPPLMAHTLAPSVAPGAVGQFYSVSLPNLIDPNGGFAPYAYTVTSGSLAQGLSLNAETGVISGVPTGGDHGPVGVTVTDQAGQTLVLSVFPRVVALNGTIPSGEQVNVPFSYQLHGFGGQGTLAYTLVAGSSLPAGLSLSSSGLISGTPTATGNYSFSVEVQDSGDPAASDVQTFTTVVTPASPLAAMDWAALPTLPPPALPTKVLFEQTIYDPNLNALVALVVNPGTYDTTVWNTYKLTAMGWIQLSSDPEGNIFLSTLAETIPDLIPQGVSYSPQSGGLEALVAKATTSNGVLVFVANFQTSNWVLNYPDFYESQEAVVSPSEPSSLMWDAQIGHDVSFDGEQIVIPNSGSSSWATDAIQYNGTLPSSSFLTELGQDASFATSPNGGMYLVSPYQPDGSLGYDTVYSVTFVDDGTQGVVTDSLLGDGHFEITPVATENSGPYEVTGESVSDDLATGQLILFGGETPNGPSNQAWQLPINPRGTLGSSWSPVSLATDSANVPSDVGAAMNYDPANGTEVLQETGQAGGGTYALTFGGLYPAPDTVPADGSTASNVSFALLNSVGAPIIGKTVDLVTDSATAVVTPVAATSNSDGMVSFAVSDPVAETVNLTLTDPSEPGIQLAKGSLTFIPPVPDAGASAVTTSPATVYANGTSPLTVNVAVYDAQGGPVQGATVSLVPIGSDAGVSMTSVGSPVTNDSGTATFSATSVQPGTVAYAVYALPSGNASTAVDLGVATLSFAPMSIPESTLASAQIGAPYSAAVTELGGSGPYLWTASGLPAGLTIGASTGVISGTPQDGQVAGNYSFDVSVADSSATTQTANATLSLVLAPAKLAVDESGFSGGILSLNVGTPLHLRLTAQGGVAPDTWSVTNGTLPAGLQLAANGELSGTPEDAGETDVQVTSQDVTGATATASIEFSVAAELPEDVNQGSSTSPTGTATVASNNVSVVAQGAGSVTSAVYATNPGGSTQGVFQSTDDYFDVRVGQGSAFQTLSFAVSGLPEDANTVYWWDPVEQTWTAASDQSYDPGTETTTVTVTSTSTPDLTQMTGTKFGVGSPMLGVPAISSLSSTSGPVSGGTSVTVTGSNFTTNSSVQFGATEALSVDVVSSTELVAVSPPGAGVVYVMVGTADGISQNSSADQFSYVGSASADSITVQATPATVNPGGTATVTGYVYGPGGGVLPGVGVTLSASSGTVAQSVYTTDAAGEFTFSYVAPSTLTSESTILTAQVAGTSAAVQDDVLFTPAALQGTSLSATLTEGVPAVGLALTAAGGVAPYAWQFMSGTLPDGLYVTSTGAITGTPLASGTFSGLMMVTDAVGDTAFASTQFTVAAPASEPSSGSGQGSGGQSTEPVTVVTPVVTQTQPVGPPPTPTYPYDTVIASQRFGPAGGLWTVLYEGQWLRVDVPAGAFASSQTVKLVTTSNDQLPPQLASVVPAPLLVGLDYSLEGATLPLSLTVLGLDMQQGSTVDTVSLTGQVQPVLAVTRPGRVEVLSLWPADYAVVSPAVTGSSEVLPLGWKVAHVTGLPNAPAGTVEDVVMPTLVANNPLHSESLTTYVPVWYVSQLLTQLGIANTWAPENWQWTTNLSVSDPGHGATAGKIRLQLNGVVVETLDGKTAIDPTDRVNTEFVPLYYVMQAMKDAGYVSQWDGHIWSITSPGDSAS